MIVRRQIRWKRTFWDLSAAVNSMWRADVLLNIQQRVPLIRKATQSTILEVIKNLSRH